MRSVCTDDYPRNQVASTAAHHDSLALHLAKGYWNLAGGKGLRLLIESSSPRAGRLKSLRRWRARYFESRFPATPVYDPRISTEESQCPVPECRAYRSPRMRIDGMNPAALSWAPFRGHCQRPSGFLETRPAYKACCTCINPQC